MSGGRPFRESSDSYAKTGIPCGNPRRFHSHDVVRMEPGQRMGPRPQRPLDGPVEDIETEGQRQLQALLQKQLNTDVSLQQHFRQRKEFTRGAEFQPSIDEMSGARSLAEYQVQERTDRYIEEMRGYGLTLEEILYKIQSDDNTDGASKKSRLANPEFHAAKLQEINDKIEAKKQSLQSPDTFSGGKTLSRHEMELEKTLAKSNDANHFLHKVLIHDQHEDISGDSTDPMRDLPNLLDKVTGKTCLRRKQSQRKQRQAEYKISCTLECCVPSDTSAASCAHEHGDNGDQLESAAETSHIQTCAEKPADYIPSVDDKTSSKRVNTKPNKNEKSVKSTSFTVQTLSSSQHCDRLVTKPDDDSANGSAGIGVLEEAIEAVPEEVIQRYRLSDDAVRQLPRFQSYQPGEPTNVLYLKNISAKVTEADLASLFIRYQQSDSNRIVFKLLTGRMKGQAFVTFDSTTTAKEALELVHGYEFKGKPIIIQYGKQSTVS